MALSFLAVICVQSAFATTQLLLSRDSKPEGEFKGVVDLAIVPGIDHATVTVTVDGQKLADSLHAPYHLPVDLGPTPVEHKITITALGSTRSGAFVASAITRHMPLTVITGSRPENGFRGVSNAPEMTQFIGRGVERKVDVRLTMLRTASPYRRSFQRQFVEVSAKRSRATKRRFWSGWGVHWSPSKPDGSDLRFGRRSQRSLTKRDALLRILDNGAERRDRIAGIEQPLSIALVLVRRRS